MLCFLFVLAAYLLCYFQFPAANLKFIKNSKYFVNKFSASFGITVFMFTWKHFALKNILYIIIILYATFFPKNADGCIIMPLAINPSGHRFWNWEIASLNFN